MNDYTSEQFLQDMLVTLIEGFNDQTGELGNPLPASQQMHYFLSILACLTQELNGITGRMINLKTELHNMANLLEERSHG